MRCCGATVRVTLGGAVLRWQDVRRVEQQVQALQGSMDQLLQRMPHSGSQEHRASVFSQHSGPFVMLPPERERAST